MLPAAIELEFPAFWPISAVVLALVLLYARRALSRRTRPLLVLLRSLTLILLAACVVGPVYRWPARPGEASALAVVVDASASMNVADVQRPIADQLRLATTLGLLTLPPEVTQANESAEALLAAVSDDVTALTRAGEAAEYVDLTRQDPASSRTRLDAARSALEARLQQVKNSSLPDEAKSGLAVLSKSLDDAPRLIAAATEAVRESHNTALRLLAATSPEVGDALRKVASMSRYELALALANLQNSPLSRALPAGTPVRTYALSSDLLPLTADVRPTGSLTDFGELARLTAASVRTGGAGSKLFSATDVPIKAVLLLTDGRSTAAVSNDSGSGSVGGLPIFAVNVAPNEPPRTVNTESIDLPASLVVGQSARVHVKLRAVGIEGVATVRLLAAGQTQYRSLAVNAEKSTLVDFDLVADRPGALPITLVVDPPAGASPGSSIQLRRTIFVLPSRYEVVCLLSPTRGWDARLLVRQLESNPLIRLSFPRADDDLAAAIQGADAIVLEDVDPARLPADAREALAERTLSQGAGLLVLPGPHFIPQAWATEPSLARFLPSTAGWQTSPFPDALYWHTLAPPAKAPANASVPQVTYLHAAPVLLAPTDQLWRSRTLGGFPNLIEPLIEEPYAETNGSDSLSATVVGRTLAIRARRLDSTGAPAQTIAPTLTLQSETRGTRTVQTVQVSPGRYRATLQDLPDGEYTLRFLDTLDPRVSVSVGQTAEAELLNTAGDPTAVSAMAYTTGGATAPAEEIDSIVARLAQRLSSTETARTTRLWCAPATLVILLALLSTEWALRKHWGLA